METALPFLLQQEHNLHHILNSKYTSFYYTSEQNWLIFIRQGDACVALNPKQIPTTSQLNPNQISNKSH